LLGNRFLSKDGEVTRDSFSGKYVALYFSAHWCPPCRGFTPKLVETYNELKAKGENGLEVIFLSSDRDEASFKEYFDEMPWLALPFELRGEKAELSDRFGVSGIPSLVILDSELNIVNDDARSSIASDRTAAGKHTGAKFPWIPPLVPDLDESTSFINDTPTLAVLAEACSEDVRSQAMAILTAAAEKEKAAAQGSPSKLRYTIAGPSSELADRIRKLTKIGDPSETTPDVVLLDIRGNAGYYAQSEFDATEENIARISADFLAEKLPFVSL